MVKVKQAEPHKSVIKEVICQNCGATLEYTPNDVQSDKWKDISGGSAGKEWVNCPNCGKEAVTRRW